MKNLSYECIDARPQPFDFSIGFAETWNVPLNLTEEEINNGDFMPMMNYIYSLGDHFSIPDDFREKLDNTTIVEINGKYYLVLTGGGMDFSWEICKSYINLGFYPPSYFNLPRMAGRGESKRDRQVITCLKESLRFQIQQAKSRLQELRDNFKKSAVEQ